MKSLLVVLSMMTSLMVFAGASDLARVLSTKQVQNIEEQMHDEGMSLLSVKDLHVEKGIFPRCICSTVELEYKNLSSGEITKFTISTLGLGENMKVNLQKNK